MLVRRLNNLENMPIHGRFALDPHGELVLLYNIDNHMFYILETLYLLKHALQLRLLYTRDHRYAMPALPFISRLQALRDQQVDHMLITTRTETSSQKIVVAYTKGVIEVFELEGKTKKLVCVLRTVLDNSVLSIRVHQQVLYITLYNRRMQVVKLSEPNRDCLYRPEFAARHNYPSISKTNLSLNNTLQNPLHLHPLQMYRFVYEPNSSGLLHIYQLSSGVLYLNEQILSRSGERCTEFDNSEEEFTELEKQEIAGQEDYYELSACGNYLISCHRQDADREANLSGTDLVCEQEEYHVRSGQQKWEIVWRTPYKPYINQYWSNHQLNRYKQAELKRRRSRVNSTTLKIPVQKPQCKRSVAARQAPNKECFWHYNIGQFEQMVVGQYIPSSSQIVISRVMVDKLHRKRKPTLQQQPKLTGELPTQTYRIVQTPLVRVQHLKHEVVDIGWIGYNQLLYQEIDGQILYMQFGYNLFECEEGEDELQPTAVDDD